MCSSRFFNRSSKKLKQRDLLDGVEIDTLVHHGRPSDVLNALVKRHKFDMIIVGRTGDSAIKATLFGTTASRIVQHAKVPVVVVP